MGLFGRSKAKEKSKAIVDLGRLTDIAYKERRVNRSAIVELISRTAVPNLTAEIVYTDLWAAYAELWKAPSELIYDLACFIAHLLSREPYAPDHPRAAALVEAITAIYLPSLNARNAIELYFFVCSDPDQLRSAHPGLFVGDASDAKWAQFAFPFVVNRLVGGPTQGHGISADELHMLYSWLKDVYDLVVPPIRRAVAELGPLGF